jgi:hypothetical protein
VLVPSTLTVKVTAKVLEEAERALQNNKLEVSLMIEWE